MLCMQYRQYDTLLERNCSPENETKCPIITTYFFITFSKVQELVLLPSPNLWHRIEFPKSPSPTDNPFRPTLHDQSKYYCPSYS
jgi:hypothetical protein